MERLILKGIQLLILTNVLQLSESSTPNSSPINTLLPALNLKSNALIKSNPSFLHPLPLNSNHRPHRLLSLISIRGGSDGESSDFDFDDDDDDDDGDFFGLDNDADFDTMDDDFGEESTLTRTWESWKKTPPLTKAYLSASIAATGIGYLTNNNQFPPYFVMDWKPTFTKLQIWRPLTAFLNFGPFGIGYLMTGHFVWTYMSTLERLNHDAPYDFWVMILFGCASMVVGYTVLGVPPTYLGHNLSTFLVYVWSRYHEGLEVNMMELFNTRAELLPWFFLAQTALLEGEFPILDLLGIAFGHIYHHCKTTNILRTPKALIEWYKSDSKFSETIREKYKQISSDFEMQ